MGHESFIHDFAIVLAVATVTTVLFRLIRQPSVLGYLFAGLLVGPHVPLPLFADPERIHTLSEFGVVLVMFAIGLEFRIQKLIAVLPISGVTALIQIGALFWGGFSVGELLGWTTVESLFLGASIAISSTMVVSKVFEERPPSEEIRSFVFGILVLQDVAAVVLVAAMTAVASGGGLSAGELAKMLGRLGGVLILFLAGGVLIIPRLVRAVVRLKSQEVLVVVAAGVCFGFGLLAELFGYSVALGAFIAGMLVAESGRGTEVEHATKPLKDVFTAVFFVSIGMTVDPMLAVENLGSALLVFGVVVVGQLTSVMLGGILSGSGLRKSLGAGLALGQIGEFAFIISSIGVAANAVRPPIQPVLVTVAILTAFTTPKAVASADRMLRSIDRWLPTRLQNLIVFYETWFQRLRSEGGLESPPRKALRAVGVDGLALVALLAAWARWARLLGDQLGSLLPLPEGVAFALVTVVWFLVMVPFLIGLVRNARLVSTLLADAASLELLPSGAPSEAVRAVIRTTVNLLLLLGVGIPTAAILRPFLNFPVVSPILAVLLATVAVSLWRRAGRIDAEVRSGAERVVELFAQQRGETSTDLTPVTTSFFGMSELLTVRLEADDFAVGQSLAELDLRAVTGASVLAIHRPPSGPVVATGTEKLRAGDVLAIAGATETREEAERLLRHGLAEPGPAEQARLQDEPQLEPPG